MEIIKKIDFPFNYDFLELIINRKLNYELSIGNNQEELKITLSQKKLNEDINQLFTEREIQQNLPFNYTGNFTSVNIIYDNNIANLDIRPSFFSQSLIKIYCKVMDSNEDININRKRFYYHEELAYILYLKKNPNQLLFKEKYIEILKTSEVPFEIKNNEGEQIKFNHDFNLIHLKELNAL